MSTQLILGIVIGYILAKLLPWLKFRLWLLYNAYMSDTYPTYEQTKGVWDDEKK